MSESTVAKSWDRKYEDGRPNGEARLDFVDTIIDTLGETGKSLTGLYIGVGDGRNFVPLYEKGYNLSGIDISKQGVAQLQQQAPKAADKVLVRDIMSLQHANIWDYLVAIQVFQHGDRAKSHAYFQHAHQMLKPGGRLFLRVNSTSTEDVAPHDVLEFADGRGRTIIKHADRDKGPIHFFDHAELEELGQQLGFETVLPLYEVSTARPDGSTWTQWETVWQKAA